MKDLSLFTAILFSGMIGGLMFGWTVSILPGLRKVSDLTYVSTMQTINREIINPGFTIPFTITPVVLAVAAFVHFRSGQTRRGWLLASACATYVIGVIVVTVGGNIPLNNTLDEFDISAATSDALSAQRADYEGPWNAWHYARTSASMVALALSAAAALVVAESE